MMSYRLIFLFIQFIVAMISTLRWTGTFCMAWRVHVTAQKMKFSIKDFFSNCDQFRSSLRIWSHLLKKFLMEIFIFCAMYRILVFMQKSVFSCPFWKLVYQVFEVLSFVYLFGCSFIFWLSFMIGLINNIINSF